MKILKVLEAKVEELRPQQKEKELQMTFLDVGDLDDNVCRMERLRDGEHVAQRAPTADIFANGDAKLFAVFFSKTHRLPLLFALFFLACAHTRARMRFCVLLSAGNLARAG